MTRGDAAQGPRTTALALETLAVLYMVKVVTVPKILLKKGASQAGAPWSCGRRRVAHRTPPFLSLITHPLATPPLITPPLITPPLITPPLITLGRPRRSTACYTASPVTPQQPAPKRRETHHIQVHHGQLHRRFRSPCIMNRVSVGSSRLRMCVPGRTTTEWSRIRESADFRLAHARGRRRRIAILNP